MEKRRRMCGNQVDRISMLPDKLLVLILSKLTYTEARATSILSSRWRYLWTFTAKLDFDGSKLLSVTRDICDKERRKYISWVNQSIALHKNSTVEEFRVNFDLNKSDKSVIYKWLRYALSKKVQRLELNLASEDCFTFPYQRLHKEKKIHDSIDFNYLKKISLCYVNVNGEALKFLLRNCPVLEDLSLYVCANLLSVSIKKPFPAFKRLEINCCYSLESLEIRDADLVYLKYMGSRIDFFLENVPMLVEVFVGESITFYVGDLVQMLSRYIPQLQILRIEADDYYDCFEDSMMFYYNEKMSNLKQLTLKIYPCDESLLLMINLLRVSPGLEKLVLEFKANGVPISEVGIFTLDPYPFTLNLAWSCVHLKELEVLGYLDVKTEHELIKHFEENAVALEKILVKRQKSSPSFDQFGDPFEADVVGNASEQKLIKKIVYLREQI